MRIFAGYAGWGAGQLDDEITEGSWYVVAGQEPDVFRSTRPTCGATSCRQPGQLAWHSSAPSVTPTVTAD